MRNPLESILTGLNQKMTPSIQKRLRAVRIDSRHRRKENEMINQFVNLVGARYGNPEKQFLGSEKLSYGQPVKVFLTIHIEDFVEVQGLFKATATGKRGKDGTHLIKYRKGGRNWTVKVKSRNILIRW